MADLANVPQIEKAVESIYADCKERSCQCIAILGSTGVGKSDVADRLAVLLGGEVVSADSMQIYRGMDIGTAKVPLDERSVAYHCLDLVDPGETYSAANYQVDARAAIDGIIAKGARPIICGGTGLYVRAALDEMDFPRGEQIGNPIRDKYTKIYEEHGAQYLYDLLKSADPKSAELIHPNNVRRVIRAFEMLDEGVSYAKQNEGMKEFVAHYTCAYYGLTMDREMLYERINLRVDKMVDAGLLDEVKALMSDGFEDALTSIQAIGYKELIDAIAGRCTMESAIEQIKQSTRRYSKRQGTWFRRDPRICWIDIMTGEFI